MQGYRRQAQCLERCCEQTQFDSLSYTGDILEHPQPPISGHLRTRKCPFKPPPLKTPLDDLLQGSSATPKLSYTVDVPFRVFHNSHTRLRHCDFMRLLCSGAHCGPANELQFPHCPIRPLESDGTAALMPAASRLSQRFSRCASVRPSDALLFLRSLSFIDSERASRLSAAPTLFIPTAAPSMLLFLSFPLSAEFARLVFMLLYGVTQLLVDYV